MSCSARHENKTVLDLRIMKNIAKPFVKWVGGKSQLIEQLETLLPVNFSYRKEITYIEPFVGGGAMLFHMLQKYSNIKYAVINDINPDLTTCYRIVRDNPSELISTLKDIQSEYYALPNEEVRKEFFLQKREAFNTKTVGDIDNSALFLFLNRTCFNGLYRVNKAGKFNVPFGRYKTPTICDEATIYADSNLLQRVEILTGDFEHTIKRVSGETFFYLDPPYKPLNATSNFNDYAKESFDDAEQIRLKKFCDKLNDMGVAFMLSNSDGMQGDIKDPFFDNLYIDYQIRRVLASRSINSVGSKRGKLTEIVVGNQMRVINDLFSNIG